MPADIVTEVRRDEYTEQYFHLLFCMGVKLGSLILRKEHGLRVFENGALGKTFGLRMTR
jgi:hypothetical protein